MADSEHAMQTGPKTNDESLDRQVPRQDKEKLKKWFIGSIDQGTTSTRFLIFNGLGVPVSSYQIEFKQMYPHPGCVRNLDFSQLREH